ncbi:PREDICTED: mitochondrial import receptor subunit TOM5 homolog [Apaloderma vittatum]|uniref:mitochondrial import receptor subunit TOM5 homolog n=1 Tax=Apaloderma vittatum TaxID=57397 RepID=UPI0005214742|nr:PREDICTED: mitochondrial import receptor subunit TOM5 homolog [Apaloderma vittatum]
MHDTNEQREPVILSILSFCIHFGIKEMHYNVLTSTHNFLIYVTLLWITPFTLKKLDSI